MRRPDYQHLVDAPRHSTVRQVWPHYVCGIIAYFLGWGPCGVVKMLTGNFYFEFDRPPSPAQLSLLDISMRVQSGIAFLLWAAGLSYCIVRYKGKGAEFWICGVPYLLLAVYTIVAFRGPIPLLVPPN